jgi:metallo-beta-lactamase family protein
MRITFYGAAQTVTGSQHLLNINGHTLLLECGCTRGRAKSLMNATATCRSARDIDAVILSHAHLTTAATCLLVKNGYRGPIFTTHASAHPATPC